MKNENLNGENKITNEHIKNNKRVRGLLIESNIIPENLPPEEDIKKLERRVKNDEKKIADNNKNKRKIK